MARRPDVIDLDAMVSASAQVKLNGETFEARRFTDAPWPLVERFRALQTTPGMATAEVFDLIAELTTLPRDLFERLSPHQFGQLVAQLGDPADPPKAPAQVAQPGAIQTSPQASPEPVPSLSNGGESLASLPVPSAGD